jgi:hypothetical protein
MTLEESQKEHEKTSKKGVPLHNPAVLRDIRSLRVPKFSFSDPKSLHEFTRHPALLYCLPRASAYVSGIGGGQLVENMARFFTAYTNIITASHNSLQNSSTGNLSAYLDENRPGVQFCRNNKIVLFDVFPLLNDQKIRRNWTSFYDFDIVDLKPVEQGKGDKFGNELHEFIIFLARLEGLPNEFFDINKVTMSRIIPTAKRVLLFRVICEARRKNQPLPEEKDHESLMETLFEQKCTKAGLSVKEAIGRMQKLENKRGPFGTDQFFADRDLLVAFLTELFQGTLTPCLSWFGMTQDYLYELKKKYSSTPEELLEEAKKATDMEKLSSSSRVLQPDPGYLRQSLTLHVPTHIEGNPLIPEPLSTSVRALELEAADDDDGLPPIEPLTLLLDEQQH